MAFEGSTSVVANDFTILAQGCPVGQTGLFLQGRDQGQTPLGGGFLCIGLGSGFHRVLPPLSTDASGVARRALDLRNPRVPAMHIDPGSNWNFQLWYRDPASGNSNLSDGLSVTFAP
jgi:hypothetical protein